MMFKFVAAAAGTPNKRQQTSRACNSCRRRKKRCHHNSHTESTLQAAHARSGLHQGCMGCPSPPTPAGAASQSTNVEGERTSGQAQHQLTSSEQIQWPLARLDSSQAQEESPRSAATSNGSQVSHAVSQDSGHSRFIGDLNPEGIFLAATSPNATRGSLEESVGVWLTTNLSRRVSQQGNSPALPAPSNLFSGSGSLVQRVLVPMLEQECLSTIPSPPRLEALSRIYFEKVHPIFPVLDHQAYINLDPTDSAKILLQQGICLAASKNFAARHFLVVAESSLTPRQFGDRISSVMRMTIEMGLVTNKKTIIQALALMSQFTDSPVGEDIASQLCGRAVHHVQSLGLHIKGQQEEHEEPGSTTLLCCVWAVDRMNAAFNGRPVLMHERDIRKDLEGCFEQQEPCFRLFLQVITLLDKVIDLYRPLPSSGEPATLNWEFPSFEDVVLKCGGSQIGTSALASIEILYHAVAILSCRTKSWADPLRSSISYLHQSISTSILSSNISRELQGQLTLFPFVPYAISLSMSIAYREMRHSKLPLQRARSRAQFQTLCDALSELGGIFWSASTTSEMGQKLLKEIDRVVTEVSSSENRRPRHAARNNTPANRGNFPDEHGLEIQNAALGNQHAVAFNGQPTPSMQEPDALIFDSIADIDLFGMFDPAFDLDGFDACLEGNLNPAFQTNLQ